MGGPGSGNWYRTATKATVEDSLALGIGEFRGRLDSGSAGTFTWTMAGEETGSVGYFVTWETDRPIVTLHYRYRHETEVRMPIRLAATRPALGGLRWWFICPLVVAGVPCNRRAGKLFLPPGDRYFGCRRCHNLTYRSAQEAHQAERMFAYLDSYLAANGVGSTVFGKTQ